MGMFPMSPQQPHVQWLGRDLCSRRHYCLHFSLSYKSPWKSLPRKKWTLKVENAGQPDKSVRFSVGNIEGVQRKASFKVSFLKALSAPSLGVLIFYSFSLKYLLSLFAFRSLSKELKSSSDSRERRKQTYINGQFLLEFNAPSDYQTKRSETRVTTLSF